MFFLPSVANYILLWSVDRRGACAQLHLSSLSLLTDSPSIGTKDVIWAVTTQFVSKTQTALNSAPKTETR